MKKMKCFHKTSNSVMELEGKLSTPEINTLLLLLLLFFLYLEIWNLDRTTIFSPLFVALLFIGCGV